MLNLREYRDKPRLLSDYLPWACSPAPGIVLNKDGSFQKTFRYRGPDLESATDAELIARHARVNNVLRRFGSGWALFFEAVRTPPMIIRIRILATPPPGWSMKNGACALKAVSTVIAATSLKVIII